MKKLGLLSVLLKLAVTVTFAQVMAFAQERMVDKISWRDEPIKILKVKSKNKAIELGKKFADDDDWLTGLTVTAQNVSEKAIARIDIRLDFPRPGGGSSPETAIYMAHLIYGKEPADVAPNEVLKLVLPGETVDIKLVEANMPSYKNDLEKLGYEQPIKRVQIMVLSATFMDGSEWDGNVILYPDPNNPKRKINPRLPMDIQNPKESKSPSSQSRNSDFLPGFRFLEAGTKRAHASLSLNASTSVIPDFWLPQIPEALPCDSIFLRNDAISCGPVGEGCSYPKLVFVLHPTSDRILEVNSRVVVGQERCVYGNGALCSPNFYLVDARAPCGARLAGTCQALADWITYPSTGCIAGLFFQGPCTRSTAFKSRCDEYIEEDCSCSGTAYESPIVIDVDHSGFALTSAAHGVVFNFLDDGVPLAMAWTVAGSTNSFARA